MPYIGNPAVVGDSTNTFKLLDDIQSFTVTFDATDTAVVSISGDTLTFRNHRFLTGQRVTYTDGGGTAIGGLTDGTAYFIIKVDQNTIQLATNASNAAAGTAIDLTSGAAGGSHTLNVAFDGVNTKFSATHSSGTKASVSRAAQISLSINGVIQQPQDTGSPTTGYGVLPGSIIIFSTPPASVDKVFGTFIGEVAPSFDIDDNTIDNFTGDGSTTTFNLSKDVPSSHDVLVTLDGVTQYPTDSSTVRAYSVIESTLTFVSAPANGVAIQVRHIGFAGASSSAVTGFYGRQGNVALTGTDDVSVQNISGVGATFTSNVNIEGVLTYEDVTNVDSIGIITARAGVLVGSGITLSKDGDGFFTGIVTATSYYGDGSNLSNITSTTINNNADNRLITGSGTANTLNGESTLTYDGTNLDLGDAKKIRLGASQDLQMYHDTESYVKSATASVNLILESAHNVAVKHGGENMAVFTGDGAVTLYHDNSAKFATTSNGASITGRLDLSDNLDMPDTAKVILGDGDDLKLHHTGGVNIIDAASSAAISFRRGGSEQFFIGSSEFKGGDNKQIKLGAGDDLILNHNGTNSYIDNNTGDLYIQTTGSGDDIIIQSNDDIQLEPQAGQNGIKVIGGGAVEIYHNNVKKLDTGADRVNIAGHIFITDGSRIYMSNGFGNGHATIRNEAANTAGNMVFSTRTAGGSDTSRAMFTTDGHFIPYANDTYDLGSTSQRWRNVYTTDLQLSNEGKTNDVDGTWGDYTIQEGESDLFLINNRSGKKYKFNLTEVS